MPVPPRHLPRIKGRGTVAQRDYEHWHLTRDRKGQFRTTTQENPIDFVKHRAYWIGGLAAAAALAIGGIAYAAGKSAGEAQAQTTSQALTLSGSGTYANTYPSGSTITINLPTGATWAAVVSGGTTVAAGVTATSGSFGMLSAPTSGNTAAQVVYKGGGGSLVIGWNDPKGLPQTTTLNFNG